MLDYRLHHLAILPSARDNAGVGKRASPALIPSLSTWIPDGLKEKGEALEMHDEAARLLPSPVS
jgi:hypothetical protein